MGQHNQRRSRFIVAEGLEIHVSEWGMPQAPALVMWHGLARTGRDFDTAARHFSDRFRVICPDTPGRGLSGWSSRPDVDYTIEGYGRVALSLLESLGVGDCLWVGTSMGGLLGMSLAAGPMKARIRRLVVNDMGPWPNPEAVKRIRAYVSTRPEFASVAEAESFLRQVYAPFGTLSESEWATMAASSVRRREDGRFHLHYDPEVMRVFAQLADQRGGWEAYDGVRCPTLVLRGATSDVLLPELATEMTMRGPKARLVEVEGCGHAPFLNVPGQLQLLDDFLTF